MKHIHKGKHKGKYRCHEFVLCGHRGWKKILFKLFGNIILRSNKLFHIFGKERVYLDLWDAVSNDYGIQSEYCEKCKRRTYYSGEDYWDDYKMPEEDKEYNEKGEYSGGPIYTWLYCGYCGEKIGDDDEKPRPKNYLKNHRPKIKVMMDENKL